MANNDKRWSGRSRGGGFGYNFFILLMKVAGIRSAYAFLSLVVVYFIPFAPRATRAVWFYNRRILGYGRLHSAVKLYAHYYALGQTIIDRVAIGSGMERKYKFEFENYDAFLRVLDGGRGAVIIGAHVGCWGTGAGFFGDYARKMHLVMYDAEYRQIKSVMEKHCGQEGYKVIAVNEGGIESILRIKEVLDRKEYVCFQGDRFVEGSPTVTLPFMGHEAPFPAGPFAVAGKFRVPVVFYYAMTNDEGSITFANLAQITTQENLKALGMSLLLSFVSTAICLLLAYPLAMILNSFHFKHQSFVVFLFVLPMWMNFMLRILAWQMLLSNNGIINGFLSIFGIPKLHMLNTQGAVVFGMIYDFLPFMIMPIYNSIVRIRKETIDAARDLGANSFITFFRIILPLTVPGIVSGIIMVFVPALTSFVISDLLGGGKVLLIGNVIEQSFMQGSYWNLGSGLSIVLMLFVLISMAFMNRAGESGGHAVW